MVCAVLFTRRPVCSAIQSASLLTVLRYCVIDSSVHVVLCNTVQLSKPGCTRICGHMLFQLTAWCLTSIHIQCNSCHNPFMETQLSNYDPAVQPCQTHLCANLDPLNFFCPR